MNSSNSPLNKNGRIDRTGVGVSPWFIFHGRSKEWTLMLEKPGVSTVTIEGTLVDMADGGVPTADQIYPLAGLSGLTAGGIFGNQPKLRAVRINQTVGLGVSAAHILQ